LCRNLSFSAGKENTFFYVLVLGLVVPIEISVLGLGDSRVAKSVYILGVARLLAVCTVVVVVVVLCDVLERGVVPGLWDFNANILVRNSNFLSPGIDAKIFQIFCVFGSPEIGNSKSRNRKFCGAKMLPLFDLPNHERRADWDQDIIPHDFIVDQQENLAFVETAIGSDDCVCFQHAWSFVEVKLLFGFFDNHHVCHVDSI
jgi:hypothetical protein